MEAEQDRPARVAIIMERALGRSPRTAKDAWSQGGRARGEA